MTSPGEERLRELFRRADVTPVPRRLDRGETLARARRQRLRRVGAVAAAIVVVGLVVGATLTMSGSDDVERIRPADPGEDAQLPPAPQGWTTYDDGRIAFHHPDDWSVLLAPGDGRVVVGTEPLREPDARLGLLVRPDLAFTDAFPEDGVVVAVGGDRFLPVYWGGGGEPFVGDLDAFGDETLLSGGSREEEPGIRARFATVSRSTVRLGAYLGPDTPADAWQQAERLLESLLVRQPDPSEVPPPRGAPGFEGDPGDAEADAQTEVLALRLDDGSRLALRVGERCALVVEETSGGSRTVGGDCELPGKDPGPRQLLAGAAFSSGRPASGPGGPEPGSDGPLRESMWVVGRAGDAVERVTPRVVGGGEVVQARHTLVDGWVLAVAESRIVQLVGYTASGEPVGSAWVD